VHCVTTPQPSDSAAAARDPWKYWPLLEALRYDPGLLVRRPPELPGDHLDTTIKSAFLPDIKAHGFFYRLSPNNQLMPSCIADEPRDREAGGLMPVTTFLRWRRYCDKPKGWTLSEPAGVAS
jgi:hypothetical protein